MTTIQIIILALVVFLLPAIVFKFVSPKKLGDKIDAATRRMNEKTEQLKNKSK